MALPSSGPLSLNDIQTEFGGSNPISLNEYYAGGAYVPAGTSGTYGAVPSSGTISIQNFYGTQKLAVGQQAYTTAGTYSWVAPAAVFSVSVVAVGGGGGGGLGIGGGGGGLGYKNNYSVSPGSSYTVVVGAAGTPGVACTGVSGGSSYFVSTGVVRGGGGDSSNGNPGTYTGDGGGNGGKAGVSGGGGYAVAPGGAGGYSGAGGSGGVALCYSTIYVNGQAGSGGGGGGAGGAGTSVFCPCFPCCLQWYPSPGGGGVGILGQGSSGAGGIAKPFGCSAVSTGGGAGSGGTAGTNQTKCLSAFGAQGGSYGGGGGHSGRPYIPGKGGTAGGGAVRLIWPGTTRSFPSTCTGNL